MADIKFQDVSNQ